MALSIALRRRFHFPFANAPLPGTNVLIPVIASYYLVVFDENGVVAVGGVPVGAVGESQTIFAGDGFQLRIPLCLGERLVQGVVGKGDRRIRRRAGHDGESRGYRGFVSSGDECGVGAPWCFIAL